MAARQVISTRVLALIPAAIALNVVLGATVGQVLKLPLYFDSIGTVLVGALCGPIPGLVTGALSDIVWGYAIPPPVGSPTAGPFAVTAACVGVLAGVAGRVGVFRPRPLQGGRLGVAVLLAALLLGGAVAYTFVRAFASARAFNANTGFPEGALGLSRTLFVAVVAVAAAAALAMLLRGRDLAPVLALAAGAATGVVAAVVSAPIAAYVFGGVTGSGADLLVAAFRAGGSSLYGAVLQQGLLSDPLDKMITFLAVQLAIRGLSRRQLLRFPNGDRLV